MKKVKCLLVILVLLTGLSSVKAVTVNNFSFEDDGVAQDDLTPIDWTWNDTGGRGTAGPGTEGSYFFWQGNGSTLTQLTSVVIASAGVGYTVEVDCRNSWQGSPQISLYYDDAGTPVILDSASLPANGDTWDEWDTITLTVITTTASVGKNLGIELSLANYPGNYWSEFDNVRLTNNTVALVSPANGADLVPIEGTDNDLVWTVAPTVEKIDLYFGEENDPNLSTKSQYKKLSEESAATTTYDPDPLVHNTPYYWKVVAYEPNTLGSGYLLTSSEVRSFTTGGPEPLITSITPASQAVAGDGTVDAQITVSGSNLEFYEWYKEGDVDPLSEDSKYTGVDTATLTINDVVLADEGLYYCIASNGISASTDQSASANLITRRLVSWWKLDGDLTDSVQEVVPGAPEFDGIADPNYTTGGGGITGEALDLSNSADYSPVFIAGTEGFFNFYRSGLTVSAWIKTNVNAWQPILSKRETDNIGLQIGTNENGQPYIDLDDGMRVYATGEIDDDSWHQVTSTYDGSIERIYIDGELAGTSDTYTADTSANAAPVGIAVWYVDSTQNEFDGNIDDVKIYSYALTTEEVGLDYLSMAGGDYVCNYELPELMYDFNGNCKVELDDFAAFAAAWLECNRIPDSACSL